MLASWLGMLGQAHGYGLLEGHISTFVDWESIVPVALPRY